MKLFIVSQWGNHMSPEGANDPNDTVVLVRAGGRDEAVQYAEEMFRALPPHDRIIPFANIVIEIGTDRGDSEVSRLLLGPILMPAGGLKLGYKRYWRRGSGAAEWTEETA